MKNDWLYCHCGRVPGRHQHTKECTKHFAEKVDAMHEDIRQGVYKTQQEEEADAAGVPSRGEI